MNEDSTGSGTEVEYTSTVMENHTSKFAKSNANFDNTKSDIATNTVISEVQPSNISAHEIQDFLATVMPAIHAESAKQTASLEIRLTTTSERQSAESAKLASATENVTAKFEYAHTKIMDEFSVQLNSDCVRKDNESKISKLSDTDGKRCESVHETINAHISQTGKQMYRNRKFWMHLEHYRLA